MTLRHFLRILLVCLLASTVAGHAAAPDETAKIEALISHIENLKDTSFIRNGSSYDAKSAGKFLRAKWKANKSDIVTAADFIAKAASVSSTSGKPYLIRFKDGKETACGAYLAAQLKKLEAAKPGQ